jgi:hypothetical protein
MFQFSTMLSAVSAGTLSRDAKAWKFPSFVVAVALASIAIAPAMYGAQPVLIRNRQHLTYEARRC